MVNGDAGLTGEFMSALLEWLAAGSPTPMLYLGGTNSMGQECASCRSILSPSLAVLVRRFRRRIGA